MPSGTRNSPACARHQLTLEHADNDADARPGAQARCHARGRGPLRRGTASRCLNRSSAAASSHRGSQQCSACPPVLSPPSGAMSPRRPQPARGADCPGRLTVTGGAKTPRLLTANERVRMLTVASSCRPGREQHAAAAAAAGGGGAAAHQDATAGGRRSRRRRPGAAVAKAPRRLPDPDAAAADAAKEAVMRLVGEREAAIGALRSLMPAPRGVVAGGRTASSSRRPNASRRRAPTSPSSSPRYAARAPPSAAPSLSGS